MPPSTNAVGPVLAATGAAVLLAVIINANPRYGSILLALVVFAMLTAGITRGTIDIDIEGK